MVKCSKAEGRRLKTTLRWKIPPEQRQRIQMVLLRESGLTARFGGINNPRPCWAPTGIRPQVASQILCSGATGGNALLSRLANPTA
jgi:hypothetical protein